MSPEDGGGLAAGLPPSTPSKTASNDPSPLQFFGQVMIIFYKIIFLSKKTWLNNFIISL